jgi:hypothetical protein
MGNHDERPLMPQVERSLVLIGRCRPGCRPTSSQLPLVGQLCRQLVLPARLDGGDVAARLARLRLVWSGYAFKSARRRLSRPPREHPDCEHRGSDVRKWRYST